MSETKQNTASGLILFIAGVIPVTIVLLFLVAQLIKFTTPNTSAPHAATSQKVVIKTDTGEVITTVMINADGTVSNLEHNK